MENVAGFLLTIGSMKENWKLIFVPRVLYNSVFQVIPLLQIFGDKESEGCYQQDKNLKYISKFTYQPFN